MVNNNNSIRVTLKIRNDIAANWTNNNPILAMGEFGLEQSSLLFKVGDGVTHWNDLPYLNKLDNTKLKHNADGTITFSDDFIALLNKVVTTDGGQTINGNISIMGTPTDNTHAVTKAYVDAAVANAGHLKRELVVNLPRVRDAEENTIYMVKDNSATGADKYKEYMLIGGELVQIGDTSVDLTGLITGTSVAGNLIMTDNTGALVDTGIAAADIGKLEPGTPSLLGGVKSSTADDFIRITDEANDGVGQAGFMTLNRVSTSKLYVPDGDTLILEGGNSSTGVITNG